MAVAAEGHRQVVDATTRRGVQALEQLGRLLGERHRLDAAIVELVGELHASGTVEAVEGLPLDLHLAVAHHLTGAERWTLITASQVLRHLPATARLFTDGALSWSQVRRIVSRARDLPVDDRAVLDARVAASVDDLDRLDPDALLWAVDRAVDELAGPRRVKARERRAQRANFLAVQLGLDGASTWYGQFDAVSTATALNALDRRVDLAGAGRDPQPGERKPLAARRANALVEICVESLAGQAGGKARPLVVVHCDLERVTETAAGVLEVTPPGTCPPSRPPPSSVCARMRTYRWC